MNIIIFFRIRSQIFIVILGKFSIRIVPDQTPDYVESVVKKYLEKQWAKRGSTNTCNVSMGHGGKCWVSDVNHPNYKAGRAATKMVYGVDPDLTREGKKAKVNSSPRQCFSKLDVHTGRDRIREVARIM